ncbi:MAG: VOC family protein [Pseudomonadota bacterium]
MDHVVFRVRDIARSIAFYRDVLGCPVERENEPLGLYHLRVGRAMIDLVSLDGKLGQAGGAGPGKEGRNVDHICVDVEPFDEAAIREHLASHGIKVSDSGERFGTHGMGPSIYIQDPDGNTIELKGIRKE